MVAVNRTYFEHAMSNKLLVAITSQGAVGRTFVVPDIVNTDPEGFIGVERPLRAKLAAVAYTGNSVTADAVLQRFWRTPDRQPRPDAGERLAEYLDQLTAFKIGTVLSISYTHEGRFQLKKEANAPPPEPRPRLP